MGMRSTTQAFQFNVPFEQLFQLATPAAQSVPKATVTLADPNRQVVTFDTPFGMMSWGENIVVGFIPSEAGTVVEVTCTTKGLPNLMQDSRNRKLNSAPASFIVTRPGPSLVRSARALLPPRLCPCWGGGRYCPEVSVSVQRCDLEVSEHCEMTACVASRVVSPGIVRHRPDARFSSWPFSLRSHIWDSRAG